MAGGGGGERRIGEGERRLGGGGGGLGMGKRKEERKATDGKYRAHLHHVRFVHIRIKPRFHE